MSLSFEETLDIARELGSSARVQITISESRASGIVNRYTGELVYSCKKKEEFIEEEKLFTTTGHPLHILLQDNKDTAPVNKTLQDEQQGDNIEFSLTNSLTEYRVGLVKVAGTDDEPHKLKFRENDKLLISSEELSNKTDNIFYTVSFIDVFKAPVSYSNQDHIAQ